MHLSDRVSIMSIIEDMRDKFKRMVDENTEKRMDDAYNEKQKTIERQKKELVEAWDNLEQSAKRMDKVVRQFRKAKQ